MSSDKYAKTYEEPRINNYAYEDTDFKVADSPATLDVFTDLDRNSQIFNGEIDNDGAGDILVATSFDGTTYSPNHRVKAAETFVVTGMSLNKVRITHDGTDSAYRGRFW